LGNAQRFYEYLDGNGYYVKARNTWIFWDDTRWALDDNGKVLRKVAAMVAGLPEEFAKGCSSIRQAKAAAEWAASGLPKYMWEFDRKPYLLNAVNGTINLETGVLQEHQREDFITQRLTVEYYPDAKAPVWDAFLARVLPDKEVRAYVQRCVGYSLTGSVKEEVMFMCVGSGSNGKTKFRETILGLAGSYGVTLLPETLMAGDSRGASPDVMALQGVRFAGVSESDENEKLAEAKIKRLTGGDEITGRHLYGAPIKFQPSHKLWLLTNHLPTVQGDDEGIWRRLVVIPFNVEIPEGERDKDLAGKLAGEQEGILAWAVRGCVEWQRQGLDTPAIVKNHMDAYRGRQDTLTGWISELIDTGDGHSSPLLPLYNSYKSWCEYASMRPLGQGKFRLQLLAKGYRKDPDGRAGHAVYLGIERKDKGTEMVDYAKF